MAQDYFKMIDLDLPDEQLKDWIQYALGQRDSALAESEERAEFSPYELDVLRRAANAGSGTREVVAKARFYNGPCTWEDLKSWLLDECKEVREAIIWDIHTLGDLSCGGRLCRSDAKRCIDLIAEAAKAYPEDSTVPAITLNDLADESADWLDLTWDAANGLLELNDADVNSALIACYFEHIIPQWRPDDRHLANWMSGDDPWRQLILLMVVTWQGLDDGHLREITTALTRSKDSQIARQARGVLEGKIKYGDLRYES